MISIFLCEDEASQLNYFYKVIDRFIEEHHIEAEIVSKRKDPLDTLTDTEKKEVDCSLYFIDIELKGCSMDGFKLARKLKSINPKGNIVFLTSKDELAYKVFEYKIDVLDYIIKKPEYFLSDKISKLLENRMSSIFEKVFEKMVHKDEQLLQVECGSRIVEINVNDIIFIQSMKGNHQIEIVLPYKALHTRQTLKSFSEQLDDSFLYISKSCIVQRSKMIEIDKKNRMLRMQGNYCLDISYREMKKVLNVFENKDAEVIIS